MLPTLKRMRIKQIQPYLFFGGCCEEAVEFYKTALGAEVDFMMRFKDSPDPVPEDRRFPGYEDKVMHMTFHIGSNTIMASDGCDPGSKFNGFSLSITFESRSDAEKAFNSLQEGGSVQMPLTKTFWSPCFGMLTDRFGIGWMITAERE